MNAFGVDHDLAKRDYSVAAERWRGRERKANAVENTGQTVGGAAGATIALAALRDAAYRDHPDTERKVARAAFKLGPSAGEAITRGKPGLKVLSAAVGGGAVAAAGARTKKSARKRVNRYEEMSKMAEPGSLMHRADLAKLYTESRDATVGQVRTANPKVSGLHPVKNHKAKRAVRLAVKGKPFKQFQTDDMTAPITMRGRANDGRMGPTRVLKPGEKGELLKRGIRPDPNQASVKQHKKVQGVLGTTAAVTGLAAGASKLGAKALPKMLPKVMATGKGGAYQRHLDRSADALLFGASGIGGASGIHQAQIMGAEGKMRKQPVAKVSRTAVVAGTAATAGLGAGYLHARRYGPKPKPIAWGGKAAKKVTPLRNQSGYVEGEQFARGQRERLLPTASEQKAKVAELKDRKKVAKALNPVNENRALRLAFGAKQQDTRIRAGNLVMRSRAHRGNEVKPVTYHRNRQKKVAVAIERARKGAPWSPVKGD